MDSPTELLGFDRINNFVHALYQEVIDSLKRGQLPLARDERAGPEYVMDRDGEDYWEDNNTDDFIKASVSEENILSITVGVNMATNLTAGSLGYRQRVADMVHIIMRNDISIYKNSLYKSLEPIIKLFQTPLRGTVDFRIEIDRSSAIIVVEIILAY